MGCPHLEEYDALYCVSEGKSYRPSPQQLSEHCTGGSHGECRYFKAFMEDVELFSYSI